MSQLRRLIVSISLGCNAVACAAIIAMMLITCADVVMRLFRNPIPGTYEIVGFIGLIVVAFSLAYTSIEDGHISVELIVNRLPERVKSAIDGVNALIGSSLFGLLCWQCIVYAIELRDSGEVSMTIEMPVYPFAYGISVGCGLLCVVLLLESIRFAGRVIKK